MEFVEVVRRRRMVRSYDPARPVGRQQLDQLLDLALRSPSAGHTQGWRFLVLDDITSRERYWSATTVGASETSDGGRGGGGGAGDRPDVEPDRWLAGMRTAPALIVCWAERSAYLERYAEPDKGWADRDESRWPIPYWYVDTGMAAMVLLLAAQDAGLATCFFGIPSNRWNAVRAAFSVPASLDPVGVVSVGHAAADRRSPSLRRGRRSRTRTVVYGSFAD